MNQRRKTDRRQSDEQYQPRERGEVRGPFDQRTYGNVWTRIWENQDHRGQVYFTFSQHRVYEQEGGTGVTKSFRSDDFEDVIRGAQWASGTIPRRRSSSRSRRQQVVREVNDRRR